MPCYNSIPLEPWRVCSISETLCEGKKERHLPFICKRWHVLALGPREGRVKVPCASAECPRRARNLTNTTTWGE